MDEKQKLEKEIADLEKAIESEEAQYDIQAEYPTDTAQYRNALQMHGQKISDMKRNLVSLKIDLSERFPKCPHDICDGSGIYEEQIAVDDVRERKCLCRVESDMDDDR